MKSAFRKQKRKAIKTFFSNFVTELKETNPGQWYGMAKKIGAVDQMSQGNIRVEALDGLSNRESAQQIAEHFASISNEYKPVDLTHLPSYLPAPPPPQVDEYQDYLKLKRQKKTKSTLPIDVPENLRIFFLHQNLLCPCQISLMQASPNRSFQSYGNLNGFVQYPRFQTQSSSKT